MNNPLISVILPAYNSDKFIKVAISSILNQTFTDFEFIIINDGSTDNTLQIINNFNDDRIVLINKQQNQGLIFSLNEGIKQAKGKYIARMDSDDESLPNRFSLQVDFFNDNPDIDVLGSYMLVIINNKEHLSKYPINSQQCLDELLTGPCFSHPTVMFKKSILNNIIYNRNYIFAEDYKLWTDLAKQGAKFANLPIALLNYNRHNTTVEYQNMKEQQSMAYLIRKEYIEFYLGSKLSDIYHQELSFLSGSMQNKIQLKSLNNFYTAIDKKNRNKANSMWLIFQKAMRNNIHLINYNFEKVTLSFFIYYLKYKLKNWLEK